MGSVVGSADYDVFGAPRSSSGATSTLGFTGQQTDPETGLVFLRARYLDPATGRFTSADTVQPNAPGTQGFNLYAYAANDPTRWIDPSGHSLAPWATVPALTAACFRTDWCAPQLMLGISVATGGIALQRPSGITISAAILIACALDVRFYLSTDGAWHYGGCSFLFRTLDQVMSDHAPPCAASDSCPDPNANPNPKPGTTPVPPVPVPTPPQPKGKCDDLNSNLGLALKIFIPEGRPGPNGYGLLHIMSDHGYTQAQPDHKNSHFAQGLDNRSSLEGLLHIALISPEGIGHWQWDGRNCSLEVDIGEVIGKDPDGFDTTLLKVIVNPNTLGVTTMYPVP